MSGIAFDFRGKSAFVTGAGGGIGCGVTRRLLEAGCAVTTFDRKDRPAELSGWQGELQYIKGDLTNSDQIKRAVDAGSQNGLDFVVNAAGVALWGSADVPADGSITDMDIEAWHKTMQVNLMGSIHVIRAAVPQMLARGGGSFVHIASVVGLRTMDNCMKSGPLDAYQTSKSALISISRNLALTHGPLGIRSNTVCPGAVQTPMTASIYSDPNRQAEMADRTPLKRVAKAEDITGAVLFLLSDAAAFITGVDLVVDGGLSMKLG